ncbi:hypothetical protein MTO96_016174 [Rhipicephalus appendiculatus]
MRRVQWFPMQKRQKRSSSPRSLEEPLPASCAVISAAMERSSSPKSMRRASSPPPATPHTSPQTQLRRTASSPSFCFLPCSLSELMLHESPQSTPTPPRRCETEANVAGIKKQTVMTGDSVPQLPFQGYTSRHWEPDLWSRSTQTELATESSTQTEPLAISSDGARLHDSDDTRHSFSWKLAPRWNSTPFVVTVAALGTFVFVLVVVGTVLGTNNNPKMDGFELLPDLFENEPSVSVVREEVVRITAPTTARAATTATVVTKRSATEALSSRRVKVRKVTKTYQRQSTAQEDARHATYAVRKLPTTAGRRRMWTPSPTMGHRRGVQIIGSHDQATRRDHLQEVTGDLGMPSPIVEKFDDNNISEETSDYAAFRLRKRKYRSPSTTPAGDFVEEIV